MRTAYMFTGCCIANAIRGFERGDYAEAWTAVAIGMLSAVIALVLEIRDEEGK
jgi:hypothetical protein